LLPHPHSQPLLLYPCSFTESLALSPTPVLWGRFSVLPPPPLFVLDYSSLFMLFSFVGEWFSLPRGSTGLCSRGWVGESHMLCNTHLFVLQIHASGFENGW
jgi:hypothetical protein